jgi:hypothetical protein
MIQVINGKVTATALPRVGVLKDGRSVSGYHVLPDEVLKAEGWLPDEEVKPLHDAEKEKLEFDRYEIEKNVVKSIYKIIPLPPEIITPEMKINNLKNTIADLTEELFETQHILADLIEEVLMSS